MKKSLALRSGLAGQVHITPVHSQENTGAFIVRIRETGDLIFSNQTEGANRFPTDADNEEILARIEQFITRRNEIVQHEKQRQKMTSNPIRRGSLQMISERTSRFWSSVARSKSNDTMHTMQNGLRSIPVDSNDEHRKDMRSKVSNKEV